jgi:hypothetical protein
VSDINNNNSNDKDRNNRGSEPENDSRPLVKSWIIEWHGTFGKTSSTEKDNYNEALNIFNEKTTDGKDAILYELQKSASNATVLKKTPILNSSKAKERRAKKKKEAESNNTNRKQKAEKRKDSKLSSLKLRIIILLSVIAALVVVLSLINALSNRGGVIVNPHVVVGIATNNAVQVMMTLDFLLLLQET